MHKEMIKRHYEKPVDDRLPLPHARALTPNQRRIKHRFRHGETAGAAFVEVDLNPSAAEAIPDAAVEPGTSAPAELHDPIGWLLKRLGLLFLIAVTIAVALLLALPHSDAGALPHGRMVLKTFIPHKL
jgi:hypothetical protein